MERQVLEPSGVESIARILMERSALLIEILAVAVIVIAVVFGTARYLLHLNRRQPNAYESYKTHLVKALLLGLEFLVAADIVRTVALDATLTNVAILGALVVVRTFLSWSLVVEMEGRWPWQVARAGASGSASTRQDE
jgi:uncharacterized membrane protein